MRKTKFNIDCDHCVVTSTNELIPTKMLPGPYTSTDTTLCLLQPELCSQCHFARLNGVAQCAERKRKSLYLPSADKTKSLTRFRTRDARDNRITERHNHFFLDHVTYKLLFKGKVFPVQAMKACG